MADFNLGAEVSMDVDPIKASSRTLERELKNINKSLRSQRSEFKRNELSAEQLADREKNLGKAIKAQEGLLKKRQDSLQDVRTEISKSNVVTEEQKRKLNSASRAVQQAENQLSTYNRELKETELAYKQFNRSSDQVKNSLGELKNRAKLSEIAFKQGTRSVDNYKDHLTEMNYTITKSKANINLLKQNLKEVSLAHGSTSRQADKLRNDILKESIAMQIAQGRADELSDELDEVARSQRKVALATTLMGAGFAGARSSADRIATTLRSLGEITQGVVGEVMATQFANLIPIMGSVVSAGAGIGGMLTSLAGGAIGLGGAFGIGMGAINAFAGQATYALKKLEDGELALTNETRRYQSVLSSLKNEWEGLIAQNQAKIFNTLSNGINIARTSLSNLNPFLTRTAGQIEGMSGKMLDWVKTSSNAKTAFNILNTKGTQAFGYLLQGAYHFVDGTTAVFNKLSPLFVWASQGFENMALSFRKWANSVEGSKAINGFVEYTKTNLPIVGRIFGNVFAGLFNLFSAFSGHSHNVLLGIESVTEGFRKWSEELKRSDGFKQFVEYLETNGPKVWQLIKNITGVLWGLVKGMAPVASVTLSITNAITGWMASMVNTHPMIGKILGSTVALTGAILLLLKPIFLVKGALSGMRGALLAVTGAEKLLGAQGAFATLGMKRQAIQAKITTAATKAWALVTKAAALATKGLGLALRFMTGPIGIVITIVGALTAAIIYLWKNNETFRNFVINAWNTIKNSAVAVFGFIKPYIINIWNAIKNSTIAIWNILKNAAKVTWNAIKFAVQHPIQALKNIISGIWNFIKTTSIKTWNVIKNGIVAIAKSLVNLVKVSFNGLKSFFSTLWNFVKNNSIKTWLAIKNGVLKIIRSLVNGAKTVISGLKKFVSTTWNAIKSISIKTWNAIKNGVVKAIRSMSNGVKKIVGALKAWMSKAWNAIKNTTVKLAKGLSSGVKNVFNSLSKVTRSIFNKLKKFMSNVWRSIKNTTVKFAKSLWSGVKSTWNSLSRGTRSIFNKVKNFMSNIWRNIKNTTVRYAKSLWTGVRNTFNNLYRGTRNIFNRVKSFMSNTWRSIKNTTVNMAKGLWNSVRRTFNNMNSGLKNIIGRIKGHITGMVNAVKSGLNKLIGGVNWVADKIGMKKIPTFKFHTGTESTHTQNLVTNGKLNQNTLATVGDKGKGNGPGGFRHETIIPPKGKPFITPAKDTTMPLSKGTRILNGAQTHAMLSNGMTPMFNTGTIPRFASGTKKKLFQAVGETAGKFFNSAKKLKHNAMDSIGDKTKQAKEWGGEKLSQIKGAVGKGTKWLSDKVGDIADWVGKPGKLLNKVLEAFGVNMDAFGIAKSAEIPYNLMKAMFGKLKEAAKNLIDGWLEDEFSGGGGYNPYTKSPFHMTRGWTPSGHAGIDYGAPTGTPIPSPIDGKVIQSWFSPNQPSGGNETQIWDGQKYTHIFMHQSKRKVKIGDRVHQGQIIGLVGNTGNSFGSHLHWQVNKGKGYLNNHPDSVNPLTWAKQAAKSGGGVNKAASAWKPDIRRAAKAIGVRVSNADVNDVARLIQTESSGNAGVTQQIQDRNSGGNEAQGLLQYTPGSFNSYAIRGHKNIKNGYDQLLAFFNNTDWRANLSYWKRRMASGLTGWGPTGRRKKYATGTNNARKGYATVFEKGGEIMNLRGGEQIIPNDVSIAAIERVINSDIFNRTQSAVYEAISRFADGIREEKDKQQQTEMRRNLEYQALKEQNVKLTSLVEKMDAIISTLFNLEDSNERIANKSNVIDRYSLGEEVNTIVDKRERHKNRKARFKPSVT
ncbi:peptidoglycan DD-metalloendopeptidase family protein [Staphylococcus haemolyticus]|uniref:peptidoglycan DD-metalloendopeptidase family protein n=2 Tax=Staphylococcus haemolyticus TaxID=1283 RepID=UPI0015D785C7|nr:peptidoglycan DD-metalloendopeptidase family protein [Staphylococcus haemolyticus]MCH4440227.1 peptidoglycan DD-metalloendopeptidase family protein [Staphylococcus haemolyticus]MEB3516852.1 peptidoglycan DD-metalloendopeptidase family protein [Staphylococcus haemolyticus]